MIGREEIPFIFEKDGISVAILSYVTPDTNPHLPEDAKVKPNWFYLKKSRAGYCKYEKQS